MIRRRNRRKKTEPQLVSDLVEQQFIKFHMEDHLQEFHIWQNWEEIVGKRLAKKSAPKSLEKGRLVIVIQDAAWMTQLKFMTRQIRQAINRVLQKTAVTEIYCTVGKLPPTPVEDPKPVIIDRPLTPKEEEGIENATQHVADPAVKQVVRDIMRKQFLTTTEK